LKSEDIRAAIHYSSTLVGRLLTLPEVGLMRFKTDEKLPQ